eukprot:8741729-Pyramimonas_sp.AAC.1
MMQAHLAEPDAFEINMFTFLQPQEVPAVLAPSNGTEKNMTTVIRLARLMDIEGGEDDLSRARLGWTSASPRGHG